MDLFNNISLTGFLTHIIYNLPYLYMFYIYNEVNIKGIVNKFNENFIIIVEKSQDLDRQINEIFGVLNVMKHQEEKNNNEVDCDF